jgi:soluble lytic murein transglycosylase-like protein
VARETALFHSEDALYSAIFFTLLFGAGLFTYGPVFNRIQIPPPQAPTHLTTIEPPPFPLETVVRAVAQKNDVDPRFVKSIIKAESAFDADAVSSAGALGYMQLMPETAAELGYDPAVPEQNIQAGTEYLGWLIDRYKSRRNGLQLAIAAYNGSRQRRALSRDSALP